MIAVAFTLLAAALTATPGATALGQGRQAAAGPARLAAAGAAVRRADVAGTAWYTDHTTGRLVVTVDDRVGAADLARIRAAVHGTRGGAVTIRRLRGRFAERIAGGETIVGPGGMRCTVGFNVKDGAGVAYALTAGHCTAAGGTWSIGPVVASSYPGDDFGLIQYADQSQAEGGVRAPGGPLIDITNARNPVVGESVCRIGPVTGVHCGSVTGLNATVNYGGGNVVSGMIQTDVCAEPGDSGGPLFAGSSALGITSGGSGDCTSGGTTFFQPVLEPLSAYGVMVF